MFTCKQVSNALHREDYEKLSPLRKFFLKLHVKLCIFCGKFNSQVMESQDMCRCFKEHEDAVIGEQPHLDRRKEALQQMLEAKSRESRD